MNLQTIGERIKEYEALSESRLMPRLPIVARLDGRSFSTFTKGMKRPFDDNFRKAMIETTKYLVEQTDAVIGYTQSDEISLILDAGGNDVIFNGRVQKIASNFASMASVKFLIEMQKYFPEKVSGNKTLPSFDCRVFAAPNKAEATNAIYWRVQDCVKNSISMAAQDCFSHKSLQNLNGKQMQEKLLLEGDINWNDYSSNEKQGTFVRKELVNIRLSDEKLASIKEEYRPKDGIVPRNKVIEIDMPNFLKVVNRVEFIFDRAMPVLNDGLNGCMNARDFK